MNSVTMAYTISFDGQNSGFQAGNIYGDVNTEFNFSPDRLETSLNQACMRDLRTTDSRDDKNRIEQVKGGLLKDAYRWILDNGKFKHWRWSQESCLLWVRGDPGKGKTMLLCGIIDELTQSNAEAANVSFFFCQATDVRINSATAVLRGLVHSLVGNQPPLLSHVRRRYDQAGKQVFEDTNAWEALSRIFMDILEDSNLLSTYLIIDALDECNTGLPLLLDLIVRKSSALPNVKWIVSSRNWPSIEERLGTSTKTATISLELNEASISEAVRIYIQHQVRQLTELKKYNLEISQAVFQHFSRNSQRTFLWVALVSQELAQTSRWNTLSKLNTLPSGLTALYNRMLEHILTAEDADLCQRILATMLNVYRPITLDELTGFVDMPNGVSDDYEALSEIIALCGSFLTIRKHTVFFIHHSAKEFLIEMAPTHLFKSGIKEQHLAIFQRSLKVMFATLRRNMYNIGFPGSPLNKIRRPDPDPLSAARYHCLFWVNHLQEFASQASGDLKEGGLVDKFLKQEYLHWVEAIGLLGGISEGIAAMLKLDSLLKKIGKSQAVRMRVQDSYRLIRYHRRAIESSPLQIYNSSLVFSPVQSINKVWYRNERPQWVLNEPAIEEHWSPCLQTFEGHKSSVTSVAWSPDGRRLASGSHNDDVRVWDPSTGNCILTLEVYSYSIASIVWSPDGGRLASGSGDGIFRIWDPATGQIISTLKGHSKSVWSVAWSPDGTRLASGSSDTTVRIWEPVNGQCISTLEGHSNSVNSIAWSPDGSQIASGSSDNSVRIWDPATGRCISTLEGHSNSVDSITWSPDGSRLSSGSSDNSVRIWDPATGRCTSTLEGHSDRVSSIAWSPNGSHIASGSWDRKVSIWDPATGQCMLCLEGHSDFVWSIAWSPDGRRLASGSVDKVVRIWDPVTGKCTSTLKGHAELVDSIAWSPDGSQLASGSHDNSVRIWDPAVEQNTPTLKVHSNKILSISWSPDGSRVASCSHDNTVKLWDLVSGQCVSTFKGHSQSVWSIAWAPDGSQLASGSSDNSVRIWDPATGQCMSIIEHNDLVSSIAWSPDGSHIASGSGDRKIRIWDLTTMQRTSTLEGHTNSVISIAWSPDGKRLTSGSVGPVKIWNLVTGHYMSTLEGHSGRVDSIAWSSDGNRLATGSRDGTVRIWDPATEQCQLILNLQSPGFLRFGDGSIYQLHTEIGVFDLVVADPYSTPCDQSTLLSRQVGYGLDHGRNWITFNGRNLLWLPSEFRPIISSLFLTSATTAVAIACSTGRVLIMNLSNENLNT